MISGLLRHGSLLSIANIAISLFGLISFPVFTKNLETDEYAYLSILTISTNLLISFNKLGLQHSVMRHFHEDNRSESISAAFFTVLTYSLSNAIILMITVGIFMPVIGGYSLPMIAVLCVAGSAFAGALHAVLLNVLMADQRIAAVAMINVIAKALSIFSTVTTVLLIMQSARGVVIAQFFADIVVLSLLVMVIYKYRYWQLLSFRYFSWKNLKPLLVFGIPMYGYELSHTLHNYVDRYLMLRWVSPSDIGIYSVIYNLANMIGTIIMGGVVTALLPLCLKTWHSSGRLATESLLNTSNQLLLVFAPALVAGVAVVARPLLQVFATEKYAEYAFLLPLIATGAIIFSSIGLFAAGMQIKKDAKKMLRFVIEGLILNVVLNVIYLRSFGIVAASVITVISYAWIAFRYFVESNKTVSIRFDTFLLLRSISYSILMFFASWLVSAPKLWQVILLKIAIGSIVFLGCVWFGERQLRKQLLHLWANA